MQLINALVLGFLVTVAGWAPIAGAQSPGRESPRFHFEKCFKAGMEICQFGISGQHQDQESIRSMTKLKTSQGKEIYAVREASVRTLEGRSVLFVTGSWLSANRSAKSLKDLRANLSLREQQPGLRARKSLQPVPRQEPSYENSEQDSVWEAMHHLSGDRAPSSPIIVQEQAPKIQFLELDF